MLGLDQQDHAHGLERELLRGKPEQFLYGRHLRGRYRARRIELALDPPEARRSSPREIVHVLLVEAVSLRVMRGIFGGALLDAGRAHDVSRRRRDADVVDAVIGIELAGGVILMAVPRSEERR